MAEVTVADMIRFLEQQDPDMVIRTYCYEMGQQQEILEYWVDRENDCVVIQ
jgi:hypothetical protein